MTAQELREYRLMIGVSAASMASMVGVAEADIVKMEQGKTTIPANLENKAQGFLKAGRGR